MNAYLVRTREEREYVEPVMDDGSGPSIPYWPTGIFLAATPGQAKSDALAAWTKRGSSTGVYSDDWLALRVRLLERDIELLNEGVRRGDLEAIWESGAILSPFYHWLWARVHEVLDHDGRPCDCPEEVAA